MATEEGIKPRLLLVEDDPTSQSFMATVLEAIPADVSVAANLGQAMAQAFSHDLWLIDVNLPDGQGDQLLAALRRDDPNTPAIAHTADASSDTRDRLLSAGFCEVLVKPMAATHLRNAARRALFGSARPSRFSAPPLSLSGEQDWDDATAALALGGNSANVAALRQLFLAELPSTLGQLEDAFAQADTPLLRQGLHRLRASCGYVGAVRLGSAVLRLQETPDSVEAMAALRDAASGLLA